MPMRHFCSIAAACLLACCVPQLCQALDLCKGDDIVAVEFLGKADCYWYPEAQTVLIDTLRNDRREPVRYAAVMALTEQLQRGKVPLDATSGWRKVPDPEIFTQICRLAHFQRPLTQAELYQNYRARQEIHCSKKSASTGDTCHDCCTPAALEALARTAFEKDLFCCWVEPSERIRWRAERALSLCCSAAVVQDYRQQMSDPTETPDLTPRPNDPDRPSLDDPDLQGTVAPMTQPTLLGGEIQLQPTNPTIPILGRADYSNRFNIFDNMSASPRTRVWYGFQYAQSQNNGVYLTGDTQRLFASLDTVSGRSDFIEATGFGRQPYGPSISPENEGAKEELKRQFLEYNGGRSQSYLLNPDSNMHRFGFEYALTTDFSVSMMGQYVMPLDDNEQPDSFSNPSIQLKHVFYRDEELLLSSILNIQPQISRPKFGVGEDTTRLNPGLLAYSKLSDRLFTQSAVGFSFPTESNQITTFDFALGLGWWAYRHESLEPYYRGPKPTNLVLGFIPQFEVLGKSVLGDNRVIGSFDLKDTRVQTAPGTVSPVDGSRNIYFPQDYTLFQDTAFIYRETRHNVDLTLGATAMLRDNWVYSAAVSVPVTGGNARALEFLTSLNKYF